MAGAIAEVVLQRSPADGGAIRRVWLKLLIAGANSVAAGIFRANPVQRSAGHPNEPKSRLLIHQDALVQYKSGADDGLLPGQNLSASDQCFAVVI